MATLLRPFAIYLVGMEALINYLLQFGQLNVQQIELIKQKAKPESLTKNTYFSEAGKVPKRVAFIQEGILRVCYYNNKGEEITRYFLEENHFAVDLSSFNQQIPSAEYIQAVTDCRIVVFSADALADLASIIVGWEAMLTKITSRALLDKISRISPMMAENASTRYRHFLERFPQLAHRVPLSQLASYLGITPSSLSRIRSSQ